MAPTFTKMKPKKGYQHLVEEIQNAICEGEFRVGERLPSEMKLAELFSTSRGTVREALRVLEQKGLVDIKTGVRGGPVVKGATTEAMSDSIGLLIRHQKVSLEELSEFRELLEGHVAAQAARTASPEQRDELTGIMAGIKAIAYGEDTPADWENFNRQDSRFHRALARCGGNVLIQANLDTLHENIQAYFVRYLPFKPAYLVENVNSLGAILDSVMNRNPEEARKRAVAHVRIFTRLMAQNR